MGLSETFFDPGCYGIRLFAVAPASPVEPASAPADLILRGIADSIVFSNKHQPLIGALSMQRGVQKPSLVKCFLEDND
jgi:hypothetical protein